MTNEVKFTLHGGPTQPSVPEPWPEKCPLCGSETADGYGLMGGGIGPYRYCAGDGECDWMVKRQDEECSPNRCPVCRVSIGHELLMCAKHWGLVPLGLRSRILGLYRHQRGSETHRSACFEAVRHVVTLLRPRPPEPPRAA